MTVQAPRGFSVVVQEKLDGSCVAAARMGDEIVALGRAGDLAAESRNAGRRLWASWVAAQRARFLSILAPGERLVGEWLALAHSTRYALTHEPFVVFDLMVGNERATSLALHRRVAQAGFYVPHEVDRGAAISVDQAMQKLGAGGHGATDLPEGLVYRLEDKRSVAFIAKYVRLDKVDGSLLEENSGLPPVWNWRSEE